MAYTHIFQRCKGSVGIVVLAWSLINSAVAIILRLLWHEWDIIALWTQMEVTIYYSCKQLPQSGFAEQNDLNDSTFCPMFAQWWADVL